MTHLTTKSFLLLLLAVTVAFLGSAQLAQAATTVKKPTSTTAKKVLKGLVPTGSTTVELPSPTPGTRVYLSEFEPKNYQPGEITPNFGTVSYINNQYAIINFYHAGSHLFSSGGPIADAARTSWSLVDPGGVAISEDDLRVEVFVNAYDEIERFKRLGLDPNQATASFVFLAVIRAGVAIFKVCLKSPLGFIKKKCRNVFLQKVAGAFTKIGIAKGTVQLVMSAIVECARNVAKLIWGRNVPGWGRIAVNIIRIALC